MTRPYPLTHRRHPMTETITGRGGWPILKGASTAFPGEDALACPKCLSTHVTMSVRYGPGGRLGDPGSRETNKCENCGHQHWFKPNHEMQS